MKKPAIMDPEVLGRIRLGTYQLPDGSFIVALEVYDLSGVMQEAYTRNAETPERRDELLEEAKRIVATIQQQMALSDVSLVRMEEA